jgi:hypothetical protein
MAGLDGGRKAFFVLLWPHYIHRGTKSEQKRDYEFPYIFAPTKSQTKIKSTKQEDAKSTT